MAHFTKDAICESFLRLLNEKRLDRITVKDIVDDCAVSRKTFYYYFEDIYDLLEKCFEDIVAKNAREVVDTKDFEKELLKSGKFVMQNKRAVSHVYNSVSREKLEEYLYQEVIRPITAIVRNKSAGIDCTEEDIMILSRLITYSFTGSLLGWMKDGMNSDIEYEIKRTAVMLDSSIETALKSAAENK